MCRFLYNLNEDMRRQGRYILLLCDNAPSHKHNPTDYPHVCVEFLAPNLTAWIQPLDGGMISSFKTQCKRRFVRFALEWDNQGLENIYKIDQLQAMTLAAAAWDVVAPETIFNCWKHVGLVPATHFLAYSLHTQRIHTYITDWIMYITSLGSQPTTCSTQCIT
jgi:hypothetical protein